MQPIGCLLMEVDVDEVFRALADPSRRRLLDSLNRRSGQTLGDLCGQLDMARQSVSKHLAVLEAAGLVTTVRRGREKLHYLNVAPIHAISDRWIDQYNRERVRALADLKRALEEPPMNSPGYTYTTYIRTTQERLWEALTNPVFSQRFMGHGLVTDWRVGSAYVWKQDEFEMADPEQVILEYDPYNRLAFTFHTFRPELVEAVGLSPETVERAAAERRSRVTFELEPHGEQVKLTVIQDDFDPGGTVRELVSNGWPLKFSTLKTALEKENPA